MKELAFDADEFHDASGDVPILDVEVPFLIPVGTVGAAEDSFDPLFLGDIVFSAEFRTGVEAEYGHDGVGFVEDHETAEEIWDGDVVTLDSGRGWHPESGDDFFDEFAIEVVVDESPFWFVIAIADEKAWWIVTGIEDHSVGGVKFLEPISFLAEVHEVLAIGIVFEDMVAGIAIGEKDISVGGNDDGSGVELVEVEA